MPHRYKRMGVGSPALKSGFYLFSLIFWLALKISPAMAVGHAACADISIPVNLADATRLSRTIFTAKIIGMTDLGIINLKDRESLIYSRMDVIVEDILKAPGDQNIATNQNVSVFIVNENYSNIKKISINVFNAGKHAIFMTNNSIYTISGDDAYDKKIYSEIEKRLKTPIWNGDKVVVLPCEYSVYDAVDDYVADRLSRIRDYIRLQR